MIARRLAQRLDQDLRGPALEILGARLDAGIAEACSRWPELAPLGDPLAEPFIEAIASRIEGEPDLAEAVSRLALPDVYLVTAVIAGHRVAVAVFEKLVRDETTRAVARLGRNAAAAEDVVQELLFKLLVSAARPRPSSARSGVTARSTPGCGSPPYARRSA